MSVTKHILRAALDSFGGDVGIPASVYEATAVEFGDDDARRARSMWSAREHMLVLEAERELRSGVYGAHGAEAEADEHLRQLDARFCRCGGQWVTGPRDLRTVVAEGSREDREAIAAGKETLPFVCGRVVIVETVEQTRCDACDAEKSEAAK